MKGPSIVFAREGSALDGFEESPFGGDGGSSWRRVALTAVVLMLSAFFVWYVAAAPSCGSPASMQVVRAASESEFCVVLNNPARTGFPRPERCFVRESDAEAMVRDAEARSADSLQACQAALYDHLRLATVRRMAATALRR